MGDWKIESRIKSLREGRGGESVRRWRGSQTGVLYTPKHEFVLPFFSGCRVRSRVRAQRSASTVFVSLSPSSRSCLAQDHQGDYSKNKAAPFTLPRRSPQPPCPTTHHARSPLVRHPSHAAHDDTTRPTRPLSSKSTLEYSSTTLVTTPPRTILSPPTPLLESPSSRPLPRGPLAGSAHSRTTRKRRTS